MLHRGRNTARNTALEYVAATKNMFHAYHTGTALTKGGSVKINIISRDLHGSSTKKGGLKIIWIVP